MTTPPEPAELANDQTETRARAWVAADPDPGTRAELVGLIESDKSELARRFNSRLTFGTAGLRGPLGPGPNHMNRVLVRMAARAIGVRLLDSHAEGLVVIGYDARPLSMEFAHDSARVMTRLGLRAEVTSDVVPTPVLAFNVRHRGAVAGIMVTASHNPPGDNGYKVYWDDGAQIVPPIDAEIEALIESHGPLHNDELGHEADVTIVPAADFVDPYLEAIVGTPGTAADPPLTVYTPLHGVGGATTLAAFSLRGLPAPVVVEAQYEPDGAFPTVSLPNPEEDGALDLALATATAAGASLIVAHDPDADRLGAAVLSSQKSPAQDWRVLSGDEIGTLLGDELLRRGDGPDRVVACSVVSSSSLGWVAEAHGVHFRRTLTGFKWIIRPAIEEPDLDYVFGYEEALGFAADKQVRDKDGISAAIVLSELAAQLGADGHTLGDRLDEIALRDGLSLTDQVSVRFDADPPAMADVMAALRKTELVEFAGATVVAHIDWLARENPTDMVEIDLGLAGRILIRPSGTEPKLKAYIEATRRPVHDLAEARQRLTEQLARLADAARSLLESPRCP